MADPVAEKSGFLKMYMSSHPDTLVAYAKFYGKVEDSIVSAEMAAIDSNSMTLAYKIKGSDAKKQVVVPIVPPLSGYDDVKPRLLEMKAKAQEGLGMIKAPQIKTFVFPRRALTSVAILSWFSYLQFFPQTKVAATILPFVGGLFAVKVFWAVWFGIHTLEALYALKLCRTHQTGFVVGSAYTVSTFFLGFPILASFRKRIQTARIDSVMKVE